MVASSLLPHMQRPDCAPVLQVADGKPGFFAIASPPDPNNQGLLEFLIKAQGDAATALAALEAGAEVAVSPVMGKGFPVDKIPAEQHPTVLLFATGELQDGQQLD